jgi:hypothetical protein
MIEKGGSVPGRVAMDRVEVTWMHFHSPRVVSVRDCYAPTLSRWTSPVW